MLVTCEMLPEGEDQPGLDPGEFVPCEGGANAKARRHE